MHKYSIGIICIMGIFIGFSYAQRPGDGDCGMVQGEDVLLRQTNNAELLPEEAIMRAQKNLRSFCCEQKMLRNTDGTVQTCKDQDLPANGYFPQSQYLFDHLLDVMLRRLDGNPELIYPDVELHPRAKAWRENIRQYAIIPEGVSPVELLNIAKDDWIVPIDNGLINLYGSVCTTAYDYYKGLSPSTSSPGSLATSKAAADLCFPLVTSLIQYELMYIRVTIDLLANRSLGHSMSTYLKDYYANDRLVTLQSTINEMVGAFTTVNRFYVEGTKQCSM